MDLYTSPLGYWKKSETGLYFSYLVLSYCFICNFSFDMEINREHIRSNKQVKIKAKCIRNDSQCAKNKAQSRIILKKKRVLVV